MSFALISVTNKTGLAPLAHGLNKLGWTILASGSTASYLRELSLPVKDVAEYTQCPEMLGGRVKTLHPAIHSGILARKQESDKKELERFHWNYIDLVVVNLYPFEEMVLRGKLSERETLDYIDIGGCTLIRAAAKNYERVTLACDPKNYPLILEELIKFGDTQLETRKRLAGEGFALTSQYDNSILEFFSPKLPKQFAFYPIQTLRYGENPHQKATLYANSPYQGPLGGNLLQGKPLSYNNLLDMDAAWRSVEIFTDPTACIIKHGSPSGLASGLYLTEAFEGALHCDPISAFGGVLAVNNLFDADLAKSLGNLFLEGIVAPGFTAEAREILGKRVNCRLLELPSKSLPTDEIRSVHQGLLVQDKDDGPIDPSIWKIVTKKKPTDIQFEALKFAWKACRYVKSNAIVLAQGTMTVGIGGGQPNRIDCVHMAAKRAGENAKHSVMASDAFFPFSDTVEAAVLYGIDAIIQPGGSKNDRDVIECADKWEIAMVFTGTRHLDTKLFFPSSLRISPSRSNLGSLK